MSPDEKLAQIARALRETGIDALVMGGHAVRYYGVDVWSRNLRPRLRK